MEKVTNKIDNQTSIINIETFVKALIENREPTGLHLNIEEFMLDYVEKKPAANDLAAHVYELMQVISNGNPIQTEAVLRYFLGRGIGSTPAGDDHMIGLIGMHTLTNVLHPVFIQTVKNLTESEAITTKAGHYYIRHALKGEFLPPFARILIDIDIMKPNELYEHITNVLPIGHTSGIDTIFGMLLGMLVIKEQQRMR